MAARKTKKIVTPKKDVEAPVTFVRDPSELEGAQEKYRHEFEGVPVFDGCTDAPYDCTADTDISKKIHDVIEHEYPRTRVGTDGYLQAILCELVRARLSK